MTQAKAKVQAKPAGVKIEGDLVFQRVGQGVATFKAVSKEIVSNPIIQIPAALFPDGYNPERDEVKGTFLYVVTVTEKAKK